VEIQAAGNLAHVELDLGRVGEALRRLTEVRDVCREVGEVGAEAQALTTEARVWRLLGRRDEARARLDAAAEHVNAIGARRKASWITLARALLAFDEGDTDGATREGRRALEDADASGDGNAAEEARLLLAQIALAAGDGEQAMRWAREAPPSVRSRALLAAIGAESAEAAEAELAAWEPRAVLTERMEVRHHLARATGRDEHRDEARRCLLELIASAPPEHRASMRREVPLHRAILGV
jgi:tetratricopeptide (TPR) repeat protein